MSLEFEEKGLELATYPKGSHPLDLFLQGDIETRGGCDFNSPRRDRFRVLERRYHHESLSSEESRELQGYYTSEQEGYRRSQR